MRDLEAFVGPNGAVSFRHPAHIVTAAKSLIMVLPPFHSGIPALRKASAKNSQSAGSLKCMNDLNNVRFR